MKEKKKRRSIWTEAKAKVKSGKENRPGDKKFDGVKNFYRELLIFAEQTFSEGIEDETRDFIVACKNILEFIPRPVALGKLCYKSRFGSEQVKDVINFIKEKVDLPEFKVN